MKKTTTLIVSLLLVFALCFLIIGATGKTPGLKWVTLDTFDTDWYSVTAGYPQALDVWAVVFYPSATDDRMILNDGGEDATAFYDSGLCANTYDARTFYFPPGTKVKPYFDTDDGALGDGSAAKVIIYYR